MADRVGKSEDGYRSFKGPDGDVKVRNGEWYCNPKDRTRRLMTNHLPRGARQVYACLELATMGFDREKALIQEKVGGKLTERPQTAADIARHCILDESDVSRFLKLLQEEGLVEAREIIEGKGLHKGNIQLYSWAQPREVEREKSLVRAPTIPDYFSAEVAENPDLQTLQPDLSRRRSWAKFPQTMDDGARTTFRALCEEAARFKKQFEEAFARMEDFAHAQAKAEAHIKEDKQDRHKEQTPPPSQPAVLEVPVTLAPEGDGRPGGGDLNNSSPNTNSEIRTEIERHLRTIHVPGKLLTQQTISEIHQLINTKEHLEVFKRVRWPQDMHSWGLVIFRATEIANGATDLATETPADNGSPPLSRVQQRAKEFARKMEAKQK